MRAETIAIIPARFESTRFPGKPLAAIDGVPMVVRVARQAEAAVEVARVLVATDDQRIRQVVEAAGFDAVMTPVACQSGTDRIAAALEALGGDRPALVVNVQGDEPLVDPADIDALIRATRASQCGMGTLARPIQDLASFHDRNVVKVVVQNDGRALYFSRSPIPNGAEARINAAADASERAALPLQHVGIYAYEPTVLEALRALPRSELEALEGLEQLRALENGISILVTMCVSSEPTVAVDTPQDIERVVRLLAEKSRMPPPVRLQPTRSNHGKYR